MVQLSYLHMTIGKNIALTIWTFISTVISLLFHTLSRFVITFLPRSKLLLIPRLQSSSASDFRAQEEENLPLLPFFPLLFVMKWWDQMPWPWVFFFLMLSVKPVFSLSSFTLIKRLFSSSSLSAIRVVSSAYMRLWVFLPAILIPACNSSSPAFSMMYSAHKLNKQGNNMQTCHTPLLIFNQSVFLCKVLTVVGFSRDK